MAFFEVRRPADDAGQLMRITRMTPRQWAQSRHHQGVFRDGWRHSRVDEERDALMSRAATNRKNRSIGGRSKGCKNTTSEDEFSQHHNGKSEAISTTAVKRTLRFRSSIVSIIVQCQSQNGISNGDSPLSRENCDAIESRCRRNAGLQQSPSPSLMDLSAVLGWIQKGAISKPTSCRHYARPRSQFLNRVQTWRYFTGRVLEARDTRLQMRETRPVAAPNASPGCAPITRPRIASAFDAARARLPSKGGTHEPAAGLQPNPSDYLREFGRLVAKMRRAIRRRGP